MELTPGAEFAGHRIERVAGRGGMGVVYLATHLALNRQVALKVIAPSLADSVEFRERFKRESETAASIDHPHVIPIFHAGEEDGLLFITMRYIEGTDLRGLIREGLQPGRVPPIIAQVADALDAAHASGLVHRDVKPANVLVAQRDERDHTFLTDFGLTKHAGSQDGLTKSGTWVGTLDYVAPEQIASGAVDARADVYSLGAVMYHALAGEVPFPRDTEVAKMYAHMSDDPPPLAQTRPWLPAELDEVVRRAMAKDPADRYPSAGDLGRAALAAVMGRESEEPERAVAVGEAALAGATVVDAPAPPSAPTEALAGSTATQPPPPPPPPPEPKRSRWPLLALLAALVVGGGVAAALLLGGGGDDGEASDRGDTVTVTDRDDTTDRTEEETTATPVEESDVREVLDTYALLYSSEDAGGLGALLAPGAVRRSDGDEQSRRQAIAEYRRQFAALDGPVYTLSEVQVQPGDGEASASALYEITEAGPGGGTGKISFHLVQVGDRLLIDELDIVAD